jgi:hypothetical protein
MMAKKNQIVEEYARMWPREVFDCLVPNEDSGKKKILGKGLDLLKQNERAGEVLTVNLF